jgi:hypothetical protein
VTNTYRYIGDDIADTRILENRDNVGMMRSPHLWPIPGTLPLKKRDRDPFAKGNLGYIRFDQLHPCRVYYGVVGLTHERAEDFRSFEDIFAAGWVVD